MMDLTGAQIRVYGAADEVDGGLQRESVAVIGYGHLGRTAALNLRDSGANIVVGNREDSYAQEARAEGFEVVPIPVAAARDIVFVLLPDEVIPTLFVSEIAPALKPGGAVAFASGYSLAFGLIHPPETVDVLLVAPRMAGVTARQRYLAGQGFWGCVGVEADRSGRAESRLLALTAGLGILRAGAIQMSAQMEATLDLFVEQTFGAVLGSAILAAFEVGCENGIPAEALVLEMYMSGEMESVFQAFRENGFLRASEDHGPTAVFGGITRTMALDRGAMAKSFRRILKDIQDGGFAERFQTEARNGYPLLEFARTFIRGRSPISDAENRLRQRIAASPADRSGEDNAACREAAPSPATVSAQLNCCPIAIAERRTSWFARLSRVPRQAWTVWNRSTAGMPWLYKLFCVGIYLKALLMRNHSD